MIDNRELYEYARSRGYEPLVDERFPMSHSLRVEIQKERFGKNDAEGNEKFYRFCLYHLPLVCEECGKPIKDPWAGNVSHILTRGAHQEMAHDPRNVNILCLEHHMQWESATARRGMRIERKNLERIETLKNEYK